MVARAFFLAGAVFIGALVVLNLRAGRIVTLPIINIERHKHAEGFWTVIALQVLAMLAGALLAIIGPG